MMNERFRVLLLLAAFGAAACESSGESNDTARTTGRVEQAAAVAEPTKEVRGDSRSAPELLVRWDNNGEGFRGAALSASVENTTDRAIAAQVVLVVSSRSGERRELVVYEGSIDPRTSAPVSVNVDALPIQSVGASSTVLLMARWERATPSSTDSNEKVAGVKLKSFAEPRHVTWDADFRRATVRSRKAQNAADDAAQDASERPKIQALRVRDAATGNFRAATATALADAPMAGVRSARAGATDTVLPGDFRNNTGVKQ